MKAWEEISSHCMNVYMWMITYLYVCFGKFLLFVNIKGLNSHMCVCLALQYTLVVSKL